MAEFRVGTALLMSINDARVAASQINAGYTVIADDGVNTLKTANHYLTQHQKVKELLDLYYSLVDRDTRDMDQMIFKAMEMDKSLSGSYVSLDRGLDRWVTK